MDYEAIGPVVRKGFEAGNERVVEVCSVECRLFCFQQKYTIHYKTYVSKKHAEIKVKNTRTQ